MYLGLFIVKIILYFEKLIAEWKNSSSIKPFWVTNFIDFPPLPYNCIKWSCNFLFYIYCVSTLPCNTYASLCGIINNFWVPEMELWRQHTWPEFYWLLFREELSGPHPFHPDITTLFSVCCNCVGEETGKTRITWAPSSFTTWGRTSEPKSLRQSTAELGLEDGVKLHFIKVHYKL